MAPTHDLSIDLWAHRGSHGPGGPLENTLPAFERALSEGAVGVELDVHLSADGVPVVFHDETLARLTYTADPRRIDGLTAAELGTVPLLGDARIPTLADVLDLALGRTRLNIELKDPAGVQATAKLLDGRPTAGVLISSFAESAVAAAAERLPERPRALIVEPGDGGAIDPLGAIERTRATHYHPFHGLVNRRLVAALAERGVPINVWTVNDPALARRLDRLGVAGLMSDRPGWLGRALARGVERIV